jgi:micrococcal nuclease
MRWLATALLLLTTGCTSQPQTPVSEQPSQTVSPATEASVSVPTPVVARNELPQVVSVGDGDTLRVKQGGKTITLRLGCIDAPESTQAPWGSQSANRLKQLLPAGQTVQVREIERDRYGRTVAELYLGNQSVNLMMIKEGQAVVYRDYLSGCANTQDQYLAAETQAKAQKLGFWNQNNPVMPWDYRRGKRSDNQPSNPTTRRTPQQPTASSSTPTASTNCDAAYPDVCIPPSPPDLDCKDITHRNFRVLPPDPHRFDGRDNDGIGCES